MAYVPNNLVMLIQPIGGFQMRLWTYISADALATLQGAGYFSDGTAKGMVVGDLIDIINPTGPKYIRQQVTVVTATAATVANPVAIT